MKKLRISVSELISNLNLKDKCIINGNKKEIILSQDDLNKIIDAVGQRISDSYNQSHIVNSGNKDHLMLSGIIDELKEAFHSNKNLNKVRTKI